MLENKNTHMINNKMAMCLLENAHPFVEENLQPVMCPPTKLQQLSFLCKWN
jgi:hypothetical protein